LVTWIIAVESVVLALIILLWAVTHLRDQLIQWGWLSHNSWVARNAAAAETARIWRVLKGIGFREDHFQAIVRLLDTQITPHGSDSRPMSQRLLVDLKRWTVRLEGGFRFDASGEYYVDTMGAMSLTGQDPSPLAALLEDWVKALEEGGIIPAFDVVLALKDGNLTLARQFLMRNSPTGKRLGVVCKGDRDRSLVQRDHPVPHETDFEGLRVLLADNRGTEFALNVIAVDDSCAGGKSLCHAMRRFNELIAAKSYNIKPVKHAVVLYAVKDKATEANFQSMGFELHAVVSLGRREMAELLDREPRELDPEGFRQGFGCESARRLAV
jgi:hypothetical protein